MSGGFGALDAGLILCNGTDQGTVAGSSTGTTLTASSSTNTKGSYAQLVASSAIDAAWMLVQLVPLVGVASSSLSFGVDISFGASGSEQVIFNNLLLFAMDGASMAPTGGGAFQFLPCDIPAGTRIAARCQASTASKTCAVICTLYDSGFADPAYAGLVDAVGFGTGSTLGTAVTPGHNTKGSYSQLIASTARDYAALAVFIDIQNNATFGTNSSLLVDVGIGPSGQEHVIVPNLLVYIGNPGTPEFINNPVTPAIPLQIPAGTRVAARASAASASITTCGVTVYGVAA